MITVARCVIFYLVSTSILLLSYPQWKPYINGIEPRPFSIFDGIEMVVENGPYNSVSAQVSAIADADLKQESGFVGPMVLSFVASSDLESRSKRKDDAYFIFRGRAREFIPWCVANAGTMEIVPPQDLPQRFSSLQSYIRSKSPGLGYAVVRIRPDAFNSFKYDCVPPDGLIWKHDRQKSYFSIPRISINTWQTYAPADKELPSNLMRLYSARTCATMEYLSNDNERLDAVDASIPEKPYGYPGVHAWEFCGYSTGGGHSADEAGQEMLWEGETPLQVSNIVTVGIDAESDNERRLFLSGIALGLAGAFLVEALTLTFALTSKTPAHPRATTDSDEFEQIAERSVTSKSETIPIKTGSRWSAWLSSQRDI